MYFTSYSKGGAPGFASVSAEVAPLCSQAGGFPLVLVVCLIVFMERNWMTQNVLFKTPFSYKPHPYGKFQRGIFHGQPALGAVSLAQGDSKSCRIPGQLLSESPPPPRREAQASRPRTVRGSWARAGRRKPPARWPPSPRTVLAPPNQLPPLSTCHRERG